MRVFQIAFYAGPVTVFVMSGYCNHSSVSIPNNVKNEP